MQQRSPSRTGVPGSAQDSADAAHRPVFGTANAVALLAGTTFSLLMPHLLPLSVLVLACMVGAVGWIARWRGRPFGALLFGFSWAGLHAALALQAQLALHLEQKELTLTGRVVELPQHEARRTRFAFRIDDSDFNETTLRNSTVRLAWYDDYEAVEPGPRLQLRAGERWRFRARMRAPRGLRNPGGSDAERHALVQRLAATGYLRHPEQTARRLEAASGLQAWREVMSARIGQHVPNDSSRFLRALALGDTRGLRESDWATLRAAGLTHLIAISGFHVGIVAAAVAALAGGLWRLFPAWSRQVPRPMAMGVAALLAAIGYAALAGFALPTVRTVLMMGVWALARLGRRPASVGQALGLAVLAVLLADPLSPLAAGFWLSFAGVAWLAWCLPASDDTHWLRGFLSAQAVATVGLLPLSVVLFDQASLAGPFVNVIAIPWWSLVVVPLALCGLALEACVAGAGTIVWQAAAWCFDLTWPSFVHAAESRFALWWIAESPGWTLLLALCGAVWMLMPRGTPGKGLALCLWCPLLVPDTGRLARGELQLAVIDVGQGLSVLVKTRHHNLLYDMGPAIRDGFDAGQRAVVPTLRALGVRRLDRAVVSHGDNDHAGGLASVVRAMPPNEVLAPEGMTGHVRMRRCRAGDSWQWDGVHFRFLHPGRHFPYLGNESSCVLRIESAHGAALLTGDIGEVVERSIVRDQPRMLRADVVLVAHHGSGGSSTPAFVAATGARLALVSSGHGNRFGHPRPLIRQRWANNGAEVLDTAESGAVQVWIGAAGLQVRERRRAHPRLWDAAERLRLLRSSAENVNESTLSMAAPPGPEG